VLGEAGHEHYRVRWDDDHESVFYPSSDSTIQKPRPGRREDSDKSTVLELSKALARLSRRLPVEDLGHPVARIRGCLTCALWSADPHRVTG
jgi:hypothetical protein